MIQLLARISLVLVGSWALGKVLNAWIEKPDVNPTRVKKLGGVTLLLCLLAAFQTFNISIFNVFKEPVLSWWISLPASRALIMGLCLLFFICIMRFLQYIRNVREVPAQLITPWLLHLYRSSDVIEEHTKEIILGSRDHIEEELRVRSQTSRLIFRWVEGCQLPFTTGFFRPLVCCPIWLSSVADGAYLQVLLDHEAEHVALGHHRWSFGLGVVKALFPWVQGIVDAVMRAMELEVDKRVLRSSDDGGRLYAEALTTVIRQARETVLAGIGHDPRHIEARIHQMGRIEGGGKLFAVSALLFSLGMVAVSLGLGRPVIGDLVRLSLREQGPNLRILVGDPKAHVFSLPGLGGLLGDGIGVDARYCTAPIILVEDTRKDPFEFSGDAELSFQYQVKGQGRMAPLLVVNVEGEPVRSLIPGSEAKTQIVRILDADAGELDPGGHQVRLHLQGEPGKRVLLSGPRLGVPRGWAVEITKVEMSAGSMQDLAQVQARRTRAIHKWQSLVGPESLLAFPAPNLDWNPRQGVVGF